MPGLSCSMWDLLVAACRLLVAACMRDLVPRPGIKPRPPALGVQSLTHWTTREVPMILFLEILKHTNREKGIWFSLSLLHLKFLFCSGWKFPEISLFHLFFFKLIELFINCMVILFQIHWFLLWYFFFFLLFSMCMFNHFDKGLCWMLTSFIFILSYLIMKTFKPMILVRVWIWWFSENILFSLISKLSLSIHFISPLPHYFLEKK